MMPHLVCANGRGKQQLLGRAKEFPWCSRVIALISGFRCFIFRSVGSSPLAKFKQLVSVVGIPFHHLVKNKTSQRTLDSVGLLHCTYWQLWIPCYVFSLLCPGYSCSSEVHLGKRASCVWAVMKVGPRFWLSRHSHDGPLFTLVPVSLNTHSSGIVFTGCLQRRPSHLAAIRPLRVHITLLGAWWWLTSLVDWKLKSFKGQVWSLADACLPLPLQTNVRNVRRAPGALEQPLKQIRVSRH